MDESRLLDEARRAGPELSQEGSHVYVEGRLQTRSWDDQATGQKQYWTEVIANDIIFLDRRQEVRDDAPELDEELANPPYPGGRPAPAAEPAAPRRAAPGITPRARIQQIAPAGQDETDDELPF